MDIEMNERPGNRFRSALQTEKPLQIVGAINAYVALMAEKIGYRALYLSGAGVANSSYGLPDLGITTLDNVLEDVRRITDAVSLPLLVDIDTGWGNLFLIARTVKSMIRAGAAGVHIEDQKSAKRCGHREGKALVTTAEMVDRIKAAVDARTDPSFIIMARTDAFSVEGLNSALERARAYKDAGADMIFPEALTEKEQFALFKKEIGLPVLANMTEFGKTPLMDRKQLENEGVDMVLYPLTANRAMNLAAAVILEELRQKGTQCELLELMQTREELYEFLNYREYEQQQDRVLGGKDE